MNLPFISKKEEVKEFFLVLLLSSGKVAALLFEKTGEKLAILGSSAEKLDEALDTLEPNVLIEASDIVISDVEQKLPTDAHLDKTIFAVPQRWVEEGKIKKEHLVSLKRVCESLELTPVGFIVSIEALTSFLHQKEGAPITAIFIEVGEKHVTVTLVKNGGVLSVTEKEIEGDVIKTVEGVLLAQEAMDVLPSRIILLNFDNAKKVQQEFLSHSWSRSLPFLHLPQVSVMDPEVESQAVVSGVANQMGFDKVQGAAFATVTEEKKEEPVVEKSKEQEFEHEKQQEAQEEKNSSDLEFFPESAGFFAEKDILKEKIEVVQESNISPVINDARNSAQSVEEFTDDDVKSAVPMDHEGEEKKGLLSSFSLPFSMPKLSIGSSKNKLYLYPIIAVVVLIALSVLYYFFFEKATVTVYLKKTEISKELPITFSTDEVSNVEDGILQLETRSITAEGEESKKATGTKKTGEKAAGEVTILSSQNKETTISKGTTLKGPNSLEFVLDSDVKIASSSGISDIKSVKAKVTASEFGKEYNLPSGSKFSVAGFDTSSVEGKNDTAFSGGSSRDITIITKEDLSALESALLERLQGEAITKASSEKDPDEDILQNPLAFEFEKETYSGKEGAEAATVKLTGTVVFDMGVYKKSDLLSFAKEAASGEVEDGSEFSEKDSQVSVKDIEEDNGGTTGILVFSSVFLPKIEQEGLNEKITGKNSESAIELLSENGVDDVEVEFTRSIPFLPKLLPFNKNNITIVLQAAP